MSIGEQVVAHGATARPLRQAVRACMPHLWAVAAFSLVLNLLYIAPTLYMLQVYDRVVPTRGELTLVFLTIVLVVALLALAGLDLLRGRILVRASARLDKVVAPAILAALMRPTDQGRASAPLREFDNLRGVIAGPGTLALLDAPWTPIYIALGWLIHPALGLLSLVGSALLLGVAWLTERSVKQPTQRATVANARAYASLDQTIAVSETVRGLGMANSMVEHHLEQRREAGELVLPSAFRSSSFLAVTKFLRQLLQSLALGLGALLAIRQDISPGAIFAASLLVTRALAPIEQMVSNWRSIVQARGSWESLETLLEATAPVPRTLLPAVQGRLDVEEVVVLAGRGGPAILKRVGFRLAPGEVLGIIGPSGAGKSTLVRAIAGGIALDGGAIRLDAADLKDWDPGQLASAIGYAPQQPDLLAGSVKQNIARFDPIALHNPGLVDERVVAAATLCGAHEMILRLPDGYDTRLGPRGWGVSVGQATRVSLARALYRSPRLVVLDEPNAALDAEGEALLLGALQRLKEDGVTQVIVAHRRSVLAHADKLLVMRDGRADMFGPAEEVLARLARGNEPAALAPRQEARA